MPQIAVTFQATCEKVIQKLSLEEIQQLVACNDDETCVKIVYDAARLMTINVHPSGKSIEKARAEKDAGNKQFAKKDYTNALQSYNNGIILCPQDTAESKELLAILISNRSAVFYELSEYRKVLSDIDYLLEIGNYPAHLQHKLWLRQGRSYSALQNLKSATESFNQAIESLNNSKLSVPDVQKKTAEIKKARTDTYPPNASNELVLISSANVFVGGNQYVSAHPKVDFQQDDVQGRYAVAVDDIEAGTIIIEESPHASVTAFEHQLTNCGNCAISTRQPIACPNCAFSIFCSTNCERIANDTFHRIECGIKRELENVGVSTNMCLALRIISQRPLQFFTAKRNFLKDFMKETTKKIQPKKKVYRHDDYENVFFLCRNEFLSKKTDNVHLACMAVYLMRLLRQTTYFPTETVDESVISDDELFIAALLYRHLKVLRFNAHEMSEIRNIREEEKLPTQKKLHESDSIGSAVYPTLALFNHSCDPSFVRYNVKNRVVARTLKPIKAGEIIYENYGPLYTCAALEARQKELQYKYLFECLCAPCVELWPQFTEMNDKEMRIACSTPKCPFVFVVCSMNSEPFLTCNYCRRVTNIIGALKGLMGLSAILGEAEQYYRNGDLVASMRVYLKAINILYRHLKPPHPDMVRVQQRIRVCMVVELGNKNVNYKMKL